MRFRNNHKPWSDEDIELLDRMMRDRVPISSISIVLGRSQNAIRRTFKNTVFQQLLYHLPEDIMDTYGINEDVLFHQIVHPKFYQPIEKNTIDEHHPEASPGVCGTVVATVVGICVTAGMLLYSHILYQNW